MEKSTVLMYPSCPGLPSWRMVNSIELLPFYDTMWRSVIDLCWPSFDFSKEHVQWSNDLYQEVAVPASSAILIPAIGPVKLTPTTLRLLYILWCIANFCKFVKKKNSFVLLFSALKYAVICSNPLNLLQFWHVCGLQKSRTEGSSGIIATIWIICYAILWLCDYIIIYSLRVLSGTWSVCKLVHGYTPTQSGGSRRPSRRMT